MTSVRRGQLLPETHYFNKITDDFKLPEYLLPYVNVTALAKVHDSEDVVKAVVEPYNYYGWNSYNNHKAYGEDGRLVWDEATIVSQPLSNGILAPVTENWEGEDGREDYAYLKEKYYGSFSYTVGANTYRIDGTVAEITIWISETSPKLYYKCFIYHNDGSLYLDRHEILEEDIENDYIKMRCVKVWEELEDGDYVEYSEDGYIYDGDLGNKMTVKSWARQYLYTGSPLWNPWRLIGGYAWREADSPFNELVLHPQGKWSYWDSKLNYIVSFYRSYPLVEDGDSYKTEPTLPFVSEHVSFNILVYRNPDGYPYEVATLQPSEIGHTQTVFFRTSASTEELPTYKALIRGYIFKLAPAIRIQSEGEVPVYVDTYAPDPPYDWTPSLNHSFKNVPTYETNNEDMSFKFLVNLKNPINYYEILKFKT